MSTAPIYEALLISARQACGVANQNGRRTGPAAVQLLLVALSPVRDLLFCAKHLSFAASRVRSAMGGKGQGWGECCQNCSGDAHHSGWASALHYALFGCGFCCCIKLAKPNSTMPPIQNNIPQEI